MLAAKESVPTDADSTARLLFAISSAQPGSLGLAERHCPAGRFLLKGVKRHKTGPMRGSLQFFFGKKVFHIAWEGDF
jgi:hypothetical protein